MKKILLSSLLIFTALFAVQTICQAQVVYTVPLYRLYGKSHHFYTTNKAERDSAIESAGYVDRGIAGYVYDKKVDGTIPLYRFVKEGTLDGTRHYYAVTRAEKSAALKDGYKSEGICCYVSEKQENGAVPFYHLYLKPGKGDVFGWGDDHFYTTSDKEKFDAINKQGYIIQPSQGFIWTKLYPALQIRVPK